MIATEILIEPNKNGIENNCASKIRDVKTRGLGFLFFELDYRLAVLPLVCLCIAASRFCLFMPIIINNTSSNNGIMILSMITPLSIKTLLEVRVIVITTYATIPTKLSTIIAIQYTHINQP